MRILFLTNNKISEPLFEWLKKTEEVLLFEEKLTIEKFIQVKPDLVISYNYKYIIKKDVLELLPNKFINLHISLLPWNRGAHPNFWSFLKNTPKGVTIHLIDEGIDTGDIIIQKELYLSEDETLFSSYCILNNEIQVLFRENWDNIKNNTFYLTKQSKDVGTTNYIKDFNNIIKDSIENIWNIKIKDLKDILK